MAVFCYDIEVKTIKHKIKHHYQPTNNTCGYAALATFLSHYDIEKTPEELVLEVPQPKDAKGTSHGSVTAQLVQWCQDNQLQTHMYASDCLVLDLSWRDLNEKQILERLNAVKAERDVPALSKHWTDVYIDAYKDMLEKGAKLTVLPFIKSSLLHELLEKGPVYTNICSTAVRGDGRTVNPALRKSVIDDVKGKINTHSTVIYGCNESGDFLVSDPWDGLVTLDPETTVLAIEAAQIECDNQIFVFE